MPEEGVFMNRNTEHQLWPERYADSSEDHRVINKMVSDLQDTKPHWKENVMFTDCNTLSYSSRGARKCV